MANADDPMADEARVEDAFTQEITDYSYVPRYHVLSWMETVEGMVAGVAALPPVYLILNRDLLETGWGWKRLVPYRPGYVEWHVFKKYLGDYFDHNREAFLCAEQKPDPFGWIIAKKSALIAAAKLCLKMEKALLRYCASFLTPDDKRLILRIKDQAKQMIQSEGDQSLVVTICLEVCLLQTTPNCCQTSARDSSPPRVSLSMSLSACNTWRTGPENFLRMSSEPCSPPVRCSVPAAHLPLLLPTSPPPSLNSKPSTSRSYCRGRSRGRDDER
ncbi:hypothetical protein ZEAMMB73_Zm00001d044186 [Zea mays]|uniref:Uncharacterized protein n=1 Tax=Zea mays TaxID=4577 RepID=A0A1D6NIK8_MAIZE|nr:hypothetical protein ZEAMMB73_Zm00001d044186 [Zea mays]